MYYIHVLARVYMHVLVHNRKTCVQDSSIGDLVTHSVIERLLIFDNYNDYNAFNETTITTMTTMTTETVDLDLD